MKNLNRSIEQLRRKILIESIVLGIVLGGLAAFLLTFLQYGLR
jgi:hypothetical protein